MRHNNVARCYGSRCICSFSLATVSELVDKRKSRIWLKLNLQDNLLCTGCQ